MQGTPSHSHLPTEITAPRRVLLLDDEPAVLRMLTHVLRKAGFEVASAQSARDAMGFLKRFQFDCIITDAMMPDLTGFDFVKLVREEAAFARIPILMLTRNRTLQDVKRAVDLGVSEYVLKPIDTQLLLEKLDYCFAKADRPSGRFFELTLNGADAQATVFTEAEVRSIGESGITLAIRGTLPEKSIRRLDIAVFKSIGIQPPHLRLIERLSDPAANASVQSGSGTPQTDISPMLYRFSFVGLPEEDLKKIRIWLQRESTRRRKT